MRRLASISFSKLWQDFLDLVTVLTDSTRATIVLVMIVMLVVIVAGLAILTNNALLAGIVGIIVGATFGIVGNIVNVTWLGPLERKQGREERNANLRRALYGEIISLASNIGGKISYHKGMCDTGKTEYLKSPNPAKLFPTLSFRVYDSLKEDPVGFYQLVESSNIDFAYDRLRGVYNLLQDFEKGSIYSAKDACEKCVALIGVYKNSLLAIDEVFSYDKRISQDLDGGSFVEKWETLKKLEEGNFGALTML